MISPAELAAIVGRELPTEMLSGGPYHCLWRWVYLEDLRADSLSLQVTEAPGLPDWPNAGMVPLEGFENTIWNWWEVVVWADGRWASINLPVDPLGQSNERSEMAIRAFAALLHSRLPSLVPHDDTQVAPDN